MKTREFMLSVAIFTIGLCGASFADENCYKFEYIGAACTGCTDGSCGVCINVTYGWCTNGERNVCTPGFAISAPCGGSACYTYQLLTQPCERTKQCVMDYACVGVPCVDDEVLAISEETVLVYAPLACCQEGVP